MGLPQSHGGAAGSVQQKMEEWTQEARLYFCHRLS